MLLCAHEFSWLTKKVVLTTYNVLSISAVISAGAIFCWEYFFSKSETAHFSALFHKRFVLKEWITFKKIKERKCHMCTCIFMVHQKSCIGLSYDFIALIRQIYYHDRNKLKFCCLNVAHTMNCDRISITMSKTPNK